MNRRWIHRVGGSVALLFVLTLRIPYAQALGFDELFQDETSQIVAEISSSGELKPFANLPLPLLHFLILEKKHLYLEPTGHLLVDRAGTVRSGSKQKYDVPEDEYHPRHFRPFFVKGFWVPEEEGESFSILGPESRLPLVRTNLAGRKEILFLVHPRSEPLFAPLMATYASSLVEVPALALSSFRTLLVAIPTGDNHWTHLMVKVSLDKVINGTHRILSLKECASALGTSFVLKDKAPCLSIMEEVFSFVPRADLLSKPDSAPANFRAGMIVRPISPLLLDSRLRVVPLFSLFGRANRGLLGNMIVNSGLSPTEFVVEKILRPYAALVVDMVVRKKISIEAHSQNLMLLLDAETLQPREGGEFVYRDMGGVSLLLGAEELKKLPSPLGQAKHFYCETFIKDAVATLEGHFVSRVLFSLTKEFTQDSFYEANDAQFREWKQQSEPYLSNWMTPDRDDDSHVEKLTADKYFQYGYFERIFGSLLMQELGDQGILRAIKPPSLVTPMLSKFARDLENPLPSNGFENLLRTVLENSADE